MIVRDAFTRETPKETCLTIMDSDSAVLAKPKIRQRQKDFFFITLVPRRNEYIVRAECKCYETATARWG